MTEIKKGQFVKCIDNDDPGYNSYGWFYEKNDNSYTVAAFPCQLEAQNPCFRGHFDEVIPCHDPLPLEPTQDEWVKAAFALFPDMETIRLGKTGCVVGLGGTKGHHRTFICISRPENWENKNYFRTDFFPPPEPDYSEFIDCFGKFWHDNNGQVFWGVLGGLVDEGPFRFYCKDCDRRFMHFEPYQTPAKLED